MHHLFYEGLTDNEVEQSRRKFGLNILPGATRNRFLIALIEVVREPIFIILIFAAAIYFFLGETGEGILMLIALFIVAGIALFQEYRSNAAIASLKEASAPHSGVIRNGKLIRIVSRNIVVHDILFLSVGDIVPADATIIHSNDLSINESILTGESVAVFKGNENGLTDIYQGTIVMSGSCYARVAKVGVNTKLGQIGLSIEEVGFSKTPLQIQINRFVRGMVGYGLIAFFVVVAFNFFLTDSIVDAILHGLTLAMAILPEEIPVAFSTFMALGAYHLYKRQVIAKGPFAVETLGAATVICTDKTGTLTRNLMQLEYLYDLKSGQELDSSALEMLKHSELLEYAMWASEPIPFDPMEKSIHSWYQSVIRDENRSGYELVKEYPLSGSPPMMTHVWQNENRQTIVAVKGAIEAVLNCSTLSESTKEMLQLRAEQYAFAGFRVLAVGKSSISIDELPDNQHYISFETLGLLVFNDPPKENISQVIQRFQNAGIQVKMITGDYPQTAVAVAKQIGLAQGEKVISGEDVIKYSDLELQQMVDKTTIFARMHPEAKLKVIEALKANGEVVAMTGDGVNDGPALKAAHIGVAMGERGSELARQTSSLILVNDDLQGMVDAVKIGRRIYENLKKAIQYIISIHIPIILIVSLPLLFFWNFVNIFSPVHVIFLELIMGPTCSIIFENEPIEKGSMEKKPRKMSVHFFSVKELSISIIQGLVIALVCLTLGYWYLNQQAEETLVRTIIYSTLIFSNLFLTLVNRSFYYSIFTTLKYRNRLIPIILSISLVVLFLSIYYQPFQTLFQFQALSINQVLICLVTAAAGVLWIEVYKWFRRKRIPREN